MFPQVNPPIHGLANTPICGTQVSLDPTLAAASRRQDGTPRQLPAAPSLFTGRTMELAVLTDVATAPDAGATVVISAISGAGGIGKTALALHWAYQHLHRFPDGQLHVNLRGFDRSGRPMSTGEAVRRFLDALGVDPSTLPAELDAQAARYRDLVAGKRMLIVLDNARDVDHVTPLLPGCPTCTVLVTSRRHLVGLVALQGAYMLDLDVLPESDAHDLLVRHLGASRLAAEPQAVAELLVICAGLPLAVRIVAARAEHHPDFPLTVLAEELRDVSARLDGLEVGDLHANIRAVLSWSIGALSPHAARVFGLLGIAPGPSISLPAAVSLAALTIRQARTVLRELEHASLIQQHAPGRYRMHDLVRLYAIDVVHHLFDDAGEGALRRVLDFYTHTAFTANSLLHPHRPPIQLDPPLPGVRPQLLSGAPAALVWFDTEYPNLLAAQHAAADKAWHAVVWQLAWTLTTFQRRQGLRHDQLAVWRAALDAAAHLSDPTTRTIAHQFIGRSYVNLGCTEDGRGHLHQALTLAEAQNDVGRQAHTHQMLTRAREAQGDNWGALQHATSARDLFCALNQPVWEADALTAMGRCAAQLGEYDTAHAYCQAALTLHREHKHPEGEANTLDCLGYIDYHTGHHQRAIRSYRQALTLYRTLGNTYEIADSLHLLGHPYVVLGAHEQARLVWREALDLYQQMGRDADAARVQQQLDNCTDHNGTTRVTE
jgi:hypothetical protein